MNIFRKQILKTGYTFNYNYYKQFSTIQKDIAVNLRGGRVSFDIDFPNREKKIFFIDDNFTFAHLKGLIKMEYPYYQLDYNFQSTQKNKNYDENSQVTKFLNDDAAGNITLSIDDFNYNLKNMGSFAINQNINNLWNKDESTGLNLYKKCMENNISPSHAGVLSHFLNKFFMETQKYKGKQITEKEIDMAFVKCIQDFSDPVKQKLEYLYQKRNELQSQFAALEKEKISVENAANKRINFYIKLLLLVSVAHITSFYYMIFHVEWLGWDIIEPITYSVQVFILLLGMRFYYKYRMDRGVDTMQTIWRNKMINKSRHTRDRYNDLLQNIEIKQSQMKNIDTKINIYKNRRNYQQFLKPETQQNQ